MGETAEILGENVSAVRYWSNYFEQFVKPVRNAKGNRLYHPEDIETLKQIQFLVKEQGQGAGHSEGDKIGPGRGQEAALGI